MVCFRCGRILRTALVEGQLAFFLLWWVCLCRVFVVSAQAGRVHDFGLARLSTWSIVCSFRFFRCESQVFAFLLMLTMLCFFGRVMDEFCAASLKTYTRTTAVSLSSSLWQVRVLHSRRRCTVVVLRVRGGGGGGVRSAHCLVFFIFIGRSGFAPILLRVVKVGLCYF